MSQLDVNLESVAVALEERLPALTEAIVDRIRSEVAEIRRLDGPQLVETVRENTRAALRAELDALRGGREIPSRCPTDAAEAARLAAMARLAPTVVLQTQRIGHSVVWEAFIEASEDLDLPTTARRALLEAGSRFLFDYAEVLARFVEQEHARELERRLAGSREHRVREVLDVLDGRTNGLTSLGYDLAGLHLGVVAEGQGALASVEELAEHLRARLLVVEPAGGAVWAWLGRRGFLSEAEQRSVDRLQPPDSLLALGEQAEGIEGFGLTHRQALDAYGVARRRSAAITRYRDVVLESLALQDERLARHLVDLELGPLGNGDRALALKDTLRTYFVCAQNTAASAAALGLHEQTVSNRIRAIEELIGQPVNSRRAELEAALRIEPLL